jgi:hypothetical protein
MFMCFGFWDAYWTVFLAVAATGSNFTTMGMNLLSNAGLGDQQAPAGLFAWRLQQIVCFTVVSFRS